jgi:hypothetical protein
MGDDELYRLARLCGEPLLNDDGRDYFFDGPYMFFTMV